MSNELISHVFPVIWVPTYLAHAFGLTEKQKFAHLGGHYSSKDSFPREVA